MKTTCKELERKGVRELTPALHETH